jgi:pimeloyl-ACP methyl ester carboxylesterase
MRLLDWLSTRTASLGREVADAGSMALYLRQLLRGNRARVAASEGPLAAAEPPDPALPPLLLVHGYMATRGSLHLLERRLTERGHVVLTYRLGPLNLGGIREAAELIARKVDALLEQTRVPAVNVVGHSMGGLVGLYYVKCLGGRDRVRKLVLLGSPVGGTWTAMLGLVTTPLGRGSLELLPSSGVLRDLREGPLPGGVEVVTVAGERDFFAPEPKTRLPGVRHLSVAASHSGLLVDGRVAEAIDEILRARPPAEKSGQNLAEKSADKSSKNPFKDL